jgi:hypothetical protein
MVPVRRRRHPIENKASAAWNPQKQKRFSEPSMQESRHILRPGAVKLMSLQPRMPERGQAFRTMR